MYAIYLFSSSNRLLLFFSYLVIVLLFVTGFSCVYVRLLSLFVYFVYYFVHVMSKTHIIGKYITHIYLFLQTMEFTSTVATR